MAKQIRGGRTPLDSELERFLMRIGDEGRPLNYVRGYTVERTNGAPHMITVQFIADAEFDAPPTPTDG